MQYIKVFASLENSNLHLLSIHSAVGHCAGSMANDFFHAGFFYAQHAAFWNHNCEQICQSVLSQPQAPTHTRTHTFTKLSYM